MGGNGVDLTDADGGVEFDLEGTGTRTKWAWTAPNADDAWLFLDRNGDGRVNSGVELFGNYSPQSPSSSPNGFRALAEYDKPSKGGNQDGKIDRDDAIYESLRLWQDLNHNGVSERNELDSCGQSGVATFDLDYRESRRRDRFGNVFRYRAKVTGRAHVGRWAWDVFLLRGD